MQTGEPDFTDSNSISVIFQHVTCLWQFVCKVMVTLLHALQLFGKLLVRTLRGMSK